MVQVKEVLAVLERAMATSATESDPVRALDPGRPRAGKQLDGLLLGSRAVLAVYDALDARQLADNKVAAEDAALLAVLRRLVDSV